MNLIIDMECKNLELVSMESDIKSVGFFEEIDMIQNLKLNTKKY
jgi:hypothetical protein